MGRTIRERLTVSVIAIVILVFVLMTSMILGMSFNNLEEKQEIELQLNADKYAREIETWAKGKVTTVDHTVRSIVCERAFTRNQLYRLLSAHSQGDEELLNLYVGLEDSEVVMSSKELENSLPADYDPTARGWYKSAKEKKDTIITEPYVDAASGKMCTTIAKPMYVNNKLVGVVGADILLTKIDEVVNGIDYGKGMYGFLVDNNDNYVNHPNK